MYRIIKVPTDKMEIVRCPQWDDRYSQPCYGLKPMGYNAYYCIGTKADCEQELAYFKKIERNDVKCY